MKFDRFAYEQMDMKERKALVNSDSWRLHYHLMPPTGWLNDPNGLCQYHGIYHVYYQYSPNDVEGKTKLWGHYTSENLILWKEEEPVLFEDSVYDERGVYSGSAFIENDEIHFFYTGNVKLVGDYDYINEGRLQNTIHVTSDDGYLLNEKKCIMSNTEYPQDMSCHVRDPKVVKANDMYYMVLGARDRSSKGCVLVYRSKDLNEWTYSFRIQSDEAFGYMWECPDIFELDGQYFLIVCPQGLKQEGICYENIYQCGYFPITIDFKQGTYELHEFHELDHGFDFYAPQTFMDEKGRRILYGWMGLPDIDYTNPSVQYGWQHALSLPRVLHAKQGRIYQQPAEELMNLRQKQVDIDCHDIHDGCFELLLDILQTSSFVLTLRQDVILSYEHKTGILTLELGESGYGRKLRHVQINDLKRLHIFSDTSALEIYLNDGVEVMTTRVYDNFVWSFSCSLREEQYAIKLWEMKSYTIQ